MKVVDGGEFDVTRRTIAATKLNDDDRLVSVEILNDQRNIILVSNNGYFLKFPIEQIPDKKKGAIGVRGMKLTTNDEVTNVYFTNASTDISIENNGKQIRLMDIKLLKRDTKGTKLRI